MRKVLLVGLMVGPILISCRASDAEQATPTLSPADVMNTAQAIARETRAAATPTASPTPVTPSATTPLETPTPPATSTPGTPGVVADYNANVRAGPDETYNVEDFLLQGQEAAILGRYENPASGTWWYITREQGRDGWIWGGAVTSTGNVNFVPAFTPPPTSTAVPQDTDTPAPLPSDTPSPTPT